MVAADAKVTVAGKHLTPDAPWVDVADITVRCRRKQFAFPTRYEQSMISVVRITADGEVFSDGHRSAAAPNP